MILADFGPSPEVSISILVKIVYELKSITAFMSGQEVGVEDLPKGYFSSLYFKDQSDRSRDDKGLPTVEELAELEKLETDYEGKRYDIPQEMLDIRNSKKKFDEIEQARQEAGLGSKDIRFFRQHVIDNKQSDYDYRYWLQYEVESMAAGQRSMRILTERDTEYEQAMKKLYKLSLKVSKSLIKNWNMNNQENLSKKTDAFILLKKWNDVVVNNDKYFQYAKEEFFREELELKDSELQEQISNNPLFYLLSRDSISVLFKDLNQITKLRNIDKIRKQKDELKKDLPNIEFERDKGVTKKYSDKSLKMQLNEELAKPENAKIAEKLQYYSFVCETNSMFKKLVNRIDSRLFSWFNYIKDSEKDRLQSIGKIFIGAYDLNLKSQDDYDNNRRKSISIATACFAGLEREEIIDMDVGELEELNHVYSQEYDSTGSHPNVIRLTRKVLFDDLNKGDHAIIRHFQQDEKRNMYCLPKEHHKYDIQKSAGNGGFLHHGSKSVSLHNDLLTLVRAKKYDFTRFEPSENTLNTLNILQKTQWSINLDFLHFIADFTLDGKKVDDIMDIRHAAWTRTNNMQLRKIFLDMMKLKLPDTSTKSKLRTINSTLKQTRKNLLNSGNVFWHAWFCDWRGRFNPRVAQLSPQGGDLSKSLLLFTEWKKLGKSGKKWLYVKAYDFMHEIIEPERTNQKHKFEEKESWVEKNLYKIRDISSKLNRKTSDENLKQILSNLQVKKAGPKSEIFQRIAFLIEFNRIHNELEKNNDNWDRVSSGLPIHLDASCNGFQHIAALTQNKALAKSTNIFLIKKGDEKGDLYQEVAKKALDIYKEKSNKSKEKKELMEVFRRINESPNKQEILAKNLFSRDLCKPLVMITGYGAKDLLAPLMNLNGKKNKPGWYKMPDEETPKRTIHPESILYRKIKLIDSDNDGGFGNLIFQEKDPLGPIENCILLHDLVKKLTNYIQYCIKKVTGDGFNLVAKELKSIYQEIDDSGGINPEELDISFPKNIRKQDKKREFLINRLEEYSDYKLKEILIKINQFEVNQFIPKTKARKIDEIKAHLINKKKNLLYFHWRVSSEASLVRNVRWKILQDLGPATLNAKLIPKNYTDPGHKVIIQFIQDNNDSISPEMLEVLINVREEILDKEPELEKIKIKIKNERDVKKKDELIELKKRFSTFNLTRNLNNQIKRCLILIANYDDDKKTRQLAAIHYYSRWSSKAQSRTRINTGKLMSFRKGKQKKWVITETIKLLDKMSTDVIRGLVPNFIHSFDAMHMQMIIKELSKNEINDIWAVHDSFGVHACHVEKMRDIVKNTFVELHKDPLNVHIENIRKLNSNILKKKEQKNAKEDNENKKSGDSKDSQNNQDSFSINEVLNSKYMIS